jgi:hypothetical protein
MNVNPILFLCFFLFYIFIRVCHSWKIFPPGTTLSQYFKRPLPESNYIPKGRQYHSSIVFHTWNQTEMNQLCPDTYCGPLCATTSQACENPITSTPSFNPNENSFTITNYTIGPCTDDGECCKESKNCERQFNSNGDLLTKEFEEVMIVYGGIDQGTYDSYTEENDLSCYKDFNRNCSQKVSVDIFFYFIARNLWVQVKPVALEKGKSVISPSKRFAHAAAFVNKNFTINNGARVYQRKYMFIYGGISEGCPKKICDDLWVYEIPFAAQAFYPKGDNSEWNRGNNWRSIPTSSVSPGPRSFHKIIYSEKKSAIYLFGGLTDGELYCNDLWEFNLITETWREVQSQGIDYILRTLRLWDGNSDKLKIPYAEFHPDTDIIIKNQRPKGLCVESSLMVPSCRGHYLLELDYETTLRVFFFGGYLKKKEKDVETFFNDFWILNLTNFEWKKNIDTRESGYTPATPTPRRDGSMIYSPPYVFFFGGANHNETFNNFWALNLLTQKWSELQPSEIYNRNQGLTGSLEYSAWPPKTFSTTFLRISNGMLLYGGAELFIPSRLLDTNNKSLLVGEISKLRLEYEAKCADKLKSVGINIYNNSFFLRMFHFTKDFSSCFRVFPSNEKFYYNTRYPSMPWLLSKNESCNPAYNPSRGVCFMGRLFCKKGYFGNQCQNKLCENSFCYYNTDSLSPDICIFCSGHGNCSSEGVCSCTSSYTGSDCSIVACSNNCSNNETHKVASCVVEYPKSNCRCIDSLKRGGDYCSKVFCLNTCGDDGDTESGICDENGNCICQEKENKNYTGPDCTVMRVDILEFSVRTEVFNFLILLIIAILSFY